MIHAGRKDGFVYDMLEHFKKEKKKKIIIIIENTKEIILLSKSNKDETKGIRFEKKIN